ncbi:MAG: 1-hydroxycarotenoid 3,4-desaturase CrtD [Gemmobacter sp.]|uniref:1-hydroxycarotenoid 3,4-desaturase CrtD n=1 Tax=Gemmobacter sp. TaxID=1898957 RepID=UPI003919E822
MTVQQSQDVVVIGAGVGGLAAAIRLAAAGCRVTLVEAAAGPGGKMRSLDSVAGPVDAGPTVLTMREVFDALFAVAGERLDSRLRLIAQPVLARHFWADGTRLDLTGQRDSDVAAIQAAFGARAATAFSAFHDHSGRLLAAFDAPMMQSATPQVAALAAAAARDPRLWRALLPGATLGADLLWRLPDPRLRQLFGRYATYVGGIPDLSPAVLALIWRAEARGVWAVEGGMHRLAQELAALAERLGVTVRYGTRVLGVETRNNRVCGVVLGGASREVLAAQAVVFNGDPAALRAGLLGPAAAHAVPTSATEPRSLSARVWTFAARVAGPDLALHNLFFADRAADEFGPLQQGRAPQLPTIYLHAQDRARGTPPEGPERFQLILNAPALMPGAAPETPEEKDACARMTFARLARFGLAFDPLPTPQALTMPGDFATLFPASRGALYGRSPHGLMAALRRPQARTALPGLYLAGGGAHPGAGVPMAALSGKFAAQAVLRDHGSTAR